MIIRFGMMIIPRDLMIIATYGTPLYSSDDYIKPVDDYLVRNDDYLVRNDDYLKGFDDYRMIGAP